MNFSEYFEPYHIVEGTSFKENQFFYSVTFDLKNILGNNIALLGVPEERNSIQNKGCSQSPNLVREYLYKLSKFNKNLKIVDLGNLKIGEKVSDTYFALSEVVAYLVKNNI